MDIARSFVLFSLLVPFTTKADLVWEKLKIESDAPLPGTEITLPFKFQNTGVAPVTIESVQASCTCLRTELSQKVILPGERGTLKAFVRTVGAPNSRTIKLDVITAENPTRPVHLEVRLSQNNPCTLEPAILWWNLNSQAQTQKATLRIPKGTSVKLATLPKDSPFHVHSEGSLDEEIFKIEVTPKTTRDSAEAQLQIEFQAAQKPTPERRILFLKILP